MPDTRTKRKTRTNYFYKQGGKCYWCGEDMVLHGDPKDPKLCTYDHRYHKGDPRRRCGSDYENFAACLACNSSRTE